MLEKHKHHHGLRMFDGIVDNRVQTIPKGFVVLFYALVIWGALYCGYYLLSGWSSHEEFEAAMATRQEAAAEPR